MIFKVGDWVRICKDSRYYGSRLSNPADTEGVVVEIRSYTDDAEYSREDHPVYVEWPHAGVNCYRHRDLELDEEVVYEI